MIANIKIYDCTDICGKLLYKLFFLPAKPKAAKLFLTAVALLALFCGIFCNFDTLGTKGETEGDKKKEANTHQL